MLEIGERIDRRGDPWRSIYSFLVSITAHTILAVILWSVVFATARFRSVVLTGSHSTAGESDVALELTAPAVAVVAPLMDTEMSVDTDRAIKTLISTSMTVESTSQELSLNLEPASVEFFGTRAYGHRFVFVLDISYSMDAREGERFRRARHELIRSVSQLRPGQEYFVFLFCWETLPLFYEDESFQYVEVKQGHESKLRSWVDGVTLGRGTDPRRALSLARQMKPDAVFLLSDGQFNQPGSAATRAGWIDGAGNRSRISVQAGIEIFFESIPVHTIAFENPFTQVAMEKIAATTGGSFRYVPTGSHHPIDSKRFLTALRYLDERHRSDRRKLREYQTRLSLGRELVQDGELIYAEYLVRPLRTADESKIMNKRLRQQIFAILDRELGDKRLEDYQSPPELSEILANDG